MDKLTQLRKSNPACKCVHRFVSLGVTANVGELRLETFGGKDFSVVDIIALKPNIVLSPMGSTVPEFVPADIHAGALHTFADRPVMLSHPVDSDGNAITALSPKVLEAARFGHVFEPRYDDELGLILPAWLNDDMAKDVGAEAESVLEDFRAGKSREISVGVWAYIEKLEGVSPSGVEYGAIWLDYDGDHLAILDNGDIGACSNEVGCGPILEISTKGLTMNPLKRAAHKATAAVRRLIAPVIHDAILNGEFSDREIGEKLSSALMGDIDNDSSFFGWITDIYVKQGVVIFKTFESSSHNNGGADLMMWQQGFKMDKSGIVTLKNDKKKVIGLTPVLEDAGAAVSVAVDDLDNNEGETTMSASKEVVRLAGVVINLESSLFDEDARSYLETKDETWLKATAEQFKDCGCEDGDSDGGTVAVAASADIPSASVTVARADFESMQSTIVTQGEEITQMRPAVLQLTAQHNAEKKSLVEAIAKGKPDLDTSVYETLELKPLRALHASLELEPKTVVHSYEGATGDSSPVIGAKIRTEVPNSMKAALDKRSVAVN